MWGYGNKYVEKEETSTSTVQRKDHPEKSAEAGSRDKLFCKCSSVSPWSSSPDGLEFKTTVSRNPSVGSQNGVGRAPRVRQT